VMSHLDICTKELRQTREEIKRFFNRISEYLNE